MDEKPQVKNRGKVLVWLGTAVLIAGVLAGIVVGSSTSSDDVDQQLKTSYIGPSELVVRWDGIIVDPPALAIAEGRFRNIADYAVEFRNVIYQVRDQRGAVLWEEVDEAFVDWTSVELLDEVSFECHPLFESSASSFELIIRDVQRLDK